jgi:hypothetical protein
VKYPVVVIQPSLTSPSFLRRVERNLYVGSRGDDVLEGVPSNAAIIQLSASLAEPVGRNLARVPLENGKPIPDRVLDALTDYAAQKLRRGVPVLVQCFAGLSRSASVAYAILRSVYGLPDHEALRRIETTTAGVRWPRRETIESARQWAFKRGW